MSIDIALQLYSIRDQLKDDFAGTIQRIFNIGYRNVETAGFFGVSPSTAGKVFMELGMRVCAAHTALPVADKRKEILKTLRDIDCNCVVPGFGPDKFSTLEDMKKTSNAVNEANRFCVNEGIKLCIHNHWWEYVPVNGIYPYQYLLENTESSVGFEIDTYWVKVAGFDPALAVKEIGERAQLLHFKDGNGKKGDPNLAIGSGVMDFPAIKAVGGDVTKWWIVEYDRCETDIIESVRQSLHYLEKL